MLENVLLGMNEQSDERIDLFFDIFKRRWLVASKSLGDLSSSHSSQSENSEMDDEIRLRQLSRMIFYDVEQKKRPKRARCNIDTSIVINFLAEVNH